MGSYQPCATSDHRLAIQKIEFCAGSETLAIAGAGGHVVLFKFASEGRDKELTSEVVDVIAGSNFIWKGVCEGLPLKSGNVSFGAGLQPVGLVQLKPAMPCTSLHLDTQNLYVYLDVFTSGCVYILFLHCVAFTSYCVYILCLHIYI